jgi:large subunit ribosomal protein L13
VEKYTRFFNTSEVKPQWHLVDAQGQTLGRTATKVAHLLRGKHKPTFTPNADLGDYVVVVNASKIRLTGKRPELKEYFHHSGYPGGATVERFQDLVRKFPVRVFEHAVRGMLPHNKLGRQIIKKLKVYPGPEHPHLAQQPKPLAEKN